MKLEDKRRQDEILLEEERKRKVTQSKNLVVQSELENRRREEDRRLKETQMELVKRSLDDERRQEMIEAETKKAEELKRASDLQTMARVENAKRKQELERKLVDNALPSSSSSSLVSPLSMVQPVPQAGVRQLVLNPGLPGPIQDLNPGLEPIQRRPEDLLSPIRSSRPEVILTPSATRFRGLHF